MLSLLRRCDEITASTLSLVHASFTHTFSSPKPYATQLTLIVESILACAVRARMVYPADKRTFVLLWSFIFPFPLFLFPAVRSSSSLSRLDPIEPSPL